MSPAIDIFQQVTALRKRGEVDRALEVLREALRRGGLGPEEVERAGRFLPTKKNALVSDLYDRMGFRRVETDADGSVHYAMEVEEADRPVTYLASRQAACLVESA